MSLFELILPHTEAIKITIKSRAMRGFLFS